MNYELPLPYREETILTRVGPEIIRKLAYGGHYRVLYMTSASTWTRSYQVDQFYYRNQIRPEENGHILSTINSSFPISAHSWGIF